MKTKRRAKWCLEAPSNPTVIPKFIGTTYSSNSNEGADCYEDEYCVHNLVLGTWYLVLGTWYLVLGTWYLVLGTWYLSNG